MKHEIRIKFKIQIFKIQNKSNSPPEAAVFVLVIWVLGIWICLKHRDFRFRAFFE